MIGYHPQMRETRHVKLAGGTVIQLQIDHELVARVLAEKRMRELRARQDWKYDSSVIGREDASCR